MSCFFFNEPSERPQFYDIFQQLTSHIAARPAPRSAPAGASDNECESSMLDSTYGSLLASQGSSGSGSEDEGGGAGGANGARRRDDFPFNIGLIVSSLAGMRPAQAAAPPRSPQASAAAANGSGGGAEANGSSGGAKANGSGPALAPVLSSGDSGDSAIDPQVRRAK